jgi:hypothetical protein
MPQESTGELWPISQCAHPSDVNMDSVANNDALALRRHNTQPHTSWGVHLRPFICVVPCFVQQQLCINPGRRKAI